MSSTGKTPKLGLCQWELSDQFRMEDMNEDFRKIDEAIDNMSRVKLFDVTISQAVSSLQLDFTDIDLTPFAELEIFVDISRSSVNMRVNGQSGSFYTPSDVGGSHDRMTVYSGKIRFIFTKERFLHMQDEINRVYRMKRIKFPALDTIEVFVNSSDNFDIGDHISVWGVKR